MRKLLMLGSMLLLTQPIAAQVPDARAVMAAQVEALKPFDWMVGEWRGEAVYRSANSEYRLVQTERMGPLLGGSVRVVEGRGYRADGSTGFNALAIIHFDPATKAYTLNSFADGQKGSFPIVPVTDGYDWEIAAGPVIIRYQARLKDGKWVETGDRIMPNRPPVRFFEMTLERVGNGSWPAGSPVARN